MSTVAQDRAHPTVAAVDNLVDENGTRIDVPDEAELVIADDVEEAVGGTGPANWSRWALIGVVAVAFALLILQIFQAAPPPSNVQPGAPVSTPVTDPPTPAPVS